MKLRVFGVPGRAGVISSPSPIRRTTHSARGSEQIPSPTIRSPTTVLIHDFKKRKPCQATPLGLVLQTGLLVRCIRRLPRINSRALRRWWPGESEQSCGPRSRIRSFLGSMPWQALSRVATSGWQSGHAARVFLAVTSSPRHLFFIRRAT